MRRISYGILDLQRSEDSDILMNTGRKVARCVIVMDLTFALRHWALTLAWAIHISLLAPPDPHLSRSLGAFPFCDGKSCHCYKLPCTEKCGSEP